MTGRRRAVAVALVSAAILMAVVPSVDVSARKPPHLERFLHALGQVESSGRYMARNAKSGAYGKYQIMPANWKAWSRLYLGTSKARPTPKNQERVAHAKISDLYRWLDRWPTVAHWWLTGSSERDSAKWSSYSRAYVAKVMKLMGSSWRPAPKAGPKPKPKPSPTAWIDATDRRLGDRSLAIRFGSSWATARFGAYSSGHVRYSTHRGASARLTFRGDGIAWVGPVGPTRGTASVYIDGRKVATVNLHRAAFAARRVLFARPLKNGTHTVRIVVTSSGKPVAIDELIVGT